MIHLLNSDHRVHRFQSSKLVLVHALTFALVLSLYCIHCVIVIELLIAYAKCIIIKIILCLLV